MSRFCRFLAFLAATSVTALVPTKRVRAQLYGVHSGAVDLATVDATALGDSLRSSLGLYVANQWVVAGGVGALSGSLKAYLGSEPNRLGVPYMVGLGYARTLATRELLGPLHAAIGAELLAGFQHLDYRPRDAGALSLTAPLGLSLGNPASTSLGVYVAPFVESGVMRSWKNVPGSCTPYCDYRLSDTGLRSAAGVGVGGRAALGRFALELLIRDVSWHKGRLYGNQEAALGLTYRLGR